MDKPEDMNTGLMMGQTEKPPEDAVQKMQKSVFKEKGGSDVLKIRPRDPQEFIANIDAARAKAYLAVQEDLEGLKKLKVNGKKKAYKTACKEKCCLCCYTLVPITYGEEALLIAQSIQQGDYAATVSMVDMLDAAYEEAGVYELWDKGKLKEAAQKAFELKMACPFLDKSTKLCTTYSNRPICCFARLAIRQTKGLGKNTSGAATCKENIRLSKGLVIHTMATRVLRGAADLETRNDETKKIFMPLPQLVNRTIEKLTPLNETEKLAALGIPLEVSTEDEKEEAKNGHT